MAENTGKVEESVAYFDHPDQVPEPGFYTLSGTVEEDEKGTKHETTMEPDKLVYASPDGEGFQYEKPEPVNQGGGE